MGIFLMFLILTFRIPEYRNTTNTGYCRNDEKISTSTNTGPGVHQTVPSAQHGNEPGHGHSHTNTGVRDTP